MTSVVRHTAGVGDLLKVRICQQTSKTASRKFLGLVVEEQGKMSKFGEFLTKKSLKMCQNDHEKVAVGSGKVALGVGMIGRVWGTVASCKGVERCSKVWPWFELGYQLVPIALHPPSARVTPRKTSVSTPRGVDLGVFER